jgi:hypothetical protein
MYDLANFTLKDMTQCGADLRKMGVGAHSMEEAAQQVIRYLYERLMDQASNQPGCALVRLFKTHAYGELEPALSQAARGVLGEQLLTPKTRCLTLLATAGEQPEWNSRHTSVGHKAIPLPSTQMVAQFPMISRLLSQFGPDIGVLLQPDPALLLDMAQTSFNVFHVPEAVGSPYIPAQQEFVIPRGVKSVLGFGGVLPSGDVFAIIMFSKVPISRATADLFKPLSLSAKMALLPFSGSKIFA